MPGTVQAVAACTTAPDGWGRGGDGGVARVGHDAAGEGHHACLALYGGTRPSYALCDIGGQTPPRHPLRQCIIKLTGYSREISSLGSSPVLPYPRPMYYIV